MSEVGNLWSTMYKDSVPTSQRTKYVSFRKANRLILHAKTNAVSCKNNIKHRNKLSGQNADFLNVTISKG